MPSTNDQKNGPRPKRVMSESAIANAKIGPYVSGPVAISFTAAIRAPSNARPAIVSSSTGGTRSASSVAVLANSAIPSPTTPGRKIDR